jgi:hypothetical protein
MSLPPPDQLAALGWRPVTAPDSPAVAELRELAAGRCGGGDDCLDHAEAAAAALAELDEACRQPRVWLEGDEVPAGVVVIPASGYAFRTGPGPYRVQFEPLVEAVDYAAAVAAERERRALDRAESPQTPSRQCETDPGAIAPQRRSEGQHGASSVEPEATQ